MKGLEMLEIRDISDYTENVFLIDWLTFTAHGCTVDDLKSLLGFGADIPWEDSVKFRNGYPLQTYWNGITFSYGAEQEKYYKDPSKARSDMGICVNFSGKGCRAYESYGKGNWIQLLAELFTLRDSGMRERKGTIYSYNVTRIDLAYDDHIGLLNIHSIREHIEDRYYTSPAKYAEIHWSDNQDNDIQGMTCQVGSNKSDIKIRIYDKSAERGFKDRHWIRVELQLRDDRASAAALALIKNNSIGMTVSGILRNYLMFRCPSPDTNKSRWPIALWWEYMLENMVKIKLWVSPGEPYNFNNTEYWFFKQYGQAIVVMDQLHDIFYVTDTAKKLFPNWKLSPKYKKYLADLEPKKQNWDEISSESVPWEGDQIGLEAYL